GPDHGHPGQVHHRHQAGPPQDHEGPRAGRHRAADQPARHRRCPRHAGQGDAPDHRRARRGTRM
ncbi:MAG: hypothetical protein AVDCRST_MAG10-1781, partial [uncultured Acidimicrobiales bacterium]